MTLSTTLVERGHNRLRYLIIDDGGEGSLTMNIPSTGGASPDLLTDSLYGPVRTCALAFNNGLGKLPPGPKSQSDAQDIWLADDSDFDLGNGKVPRCLCVLTVRSGAIQWTVNANVDGGGHPLLTVGHASSSVGSAYLDVQTQGGIGI
jgi:hypothetical protein